VTNGMSVHRIRGQESDTGVMLCPPTAPHCKHSSTVLPGLGVPSGPVGFSIPRAIPGVLSLSLTQVALERSRSSPLTPPLAHCPRTVRDQCSHTSGLYSLSNLMRPSLPGSADINNSACISHLGMDLPALHQIIAFSVPLFPTCLPVYLEQYHS
jgi:hypothetical protein